MNDAVLGVIEGVLLATTVGWTAFVVSLIQQLEKRFSGT